MLEQVAGTSLIADLGVGKGCWLRPGSDIPPVKATAAKTRSCRLLRGLAAHLLIFLLADENALLSLRIPTPFEHMWKLIIRSRDSRKEIFRWGRIQGRR